MEMRQLRHFLALMETKSYWRAADSCGITPQALSKSIRRFEEHLGVRLFDRDTRSVKPTLFAEQIANYARNIDAEARSLRRSLDMLLGAGTNQLVVGAGAAAATKIVV
ncbi:MAG: LysR family transcriptional regulator, partial [Steroidobacteraceae bacterium]